MSVDPELLRQQLIAATLKDSKPMAALDPTGTGYDDLDSAAHGFAGRLGDRNKNLESAGVLFTGKDGKYKYSIPTTQHQRDGFALRMQQTDDSKLGGIFHTHPGTDADGQVFSPNDIRVADKLKVPSYVMFEKTGQIRKYVPGVTKTKRVYIPGSLDEDYSADGDPVPAPPDPAKQAALVDALRQ